MTARYPRDAAYYEAGHAVVAWSLGLPVGAISVSDASGSAHKHIGLTGHLPFIEQLAICYAGIAALDLFGPFTHEPAGFNDHVQIRDLIEQHGTSEEEGPALRDQAYNFARARLEAHRSKVVALAERLVEHGRIVKPFT